MATIGNTFATIVDQLKRTDPNGMLANVIQLMGQTNEIIPDMPWLECNDGSGHRTTQEIALPSTTFRRFYEGTPYTKGATVQVRDTTCQMSQRSGVDADLARSSGNPAAFRASMDDSHVVALANDFANTLFYGNTDTDPEQFHGLAPRYNDLSAPNAQNIIAGGGSGSDNTSVWLLGWGDMTVHGIHPKGLPMGVTVEDMGNNSDGTRSINDASGNPYEIFDTKFTWNVGLSVPDWRHAIRICNIDVSDLTFNAGSGANLFDLMMRAYARRPQNKGISRWSFYANATVLSFLWRQEANHSTVRTKPGELPGSDMVTVLGDTNVPVKRCDALLNTEATVS